MTQQGMLLPFLSLSQSTQKPSKLRGFSFIELLTVMAIMMLISSTILPFHENYQLESKIRNHMTQLHNLLKFTRQQAINKNLAISVCPLNQSNRCVNDWANTLTAFIDSNANSTLNSNETVITTTHQSKLSGKIRWRTNNRKITYQPAGFVNSIGSITYCPTDATNPYRFSIVISRSGRIRSSWQVAKC